MNSLVARRSQTAPVSNRAAVAHLGRAQQPRPTSISGRALVGQLGVGRRYTGAADLLTPYQLTLPPPPLPDFNRLRGQAQQLQLELARYDRQIVAADTVAAAPAPPRPRTPAEAGYPIPFLTPAEQARRKLERQQQQQQRERYVQRRLAEINRQVQAVPYSPVLMQFLRSPFLSLQTKTAVAPLGAKPTPSSAVPAGPDCFTPYSFWITQAPDWTACAKTVYKMLDKYYGKDYRKPTHWYDLVQEHKTGAWFHNIPVRKGYDILGTAKSAEGLTKLNEYMTAHKPVMVGVSHTENFYFKNYDKRTKITTYSTINDATIDHFVAIVGTGVDKKGKYYRFFDVGTADKKRGTSELNRLYLQLDGSYRGHSQATYKDYILTQVRF